jgi:glyoxylase-like metal-dependent hydrolase (beta-lactamase superfamily II)
MTYRIGLGKPVETAVYVWFIEGSKEKIVVDAGGTAEILAEVGFADKKDVQSLDEGLGKLGVKPSDIDIVIITHLHHDHMYLSHDFTKAKFVIQKKELEMAHDEKSLWRPAFRFQEQFDDLDYEILDGDEEIVPGIRVMLSPGHTWGGQSILIDTAEGLAAITGMCCIRQNFDPPENIQKMYGWSVIPPGWVDNIQQAYDSLAKIKEMAQIVIPVHDIEFLEKDKIPW